MEESEVVLDEDRLFISVIGDTPVASMFLEKIAQKISSGKFKLTEEQFMKGVGSSKQLEEKIQEFHEKISKNPGSIWDTFFDNLRKKAGALQIEDDYTVIKLKQDKELIEIIMKDKRFKNLILRAENYNILVKEEFLREVADIFREYGYYIYK
jgi:dissimilatory sulfite reductase (desulfoviridin) alpha/beta subunit